MPAEFFIDTSGWFPVLMLGDSAHARLADALRRAVAARRRAVTTNLVLAETHALLLRRAGRAIARAFLQSVAESPTLIIRSTEEIEAAVRRDWISRYTDQDFSFADAVSFSVMRERKITDALALDRHFEIAGFRLLGSHA